MRFLTCFLIVLLNFNLFAFADDVLIIDETSGSADVMEEIIDDDIEIVDSDSGSDPIYIDSDVSDLEDFGQTVSISLDEDQSIMPYYNGYLEILQQPSDFVSYTPFDQISFTVSAVDAAAYQWQYSNDLTSWKVGNSDSLNTDTYTFASTSTNTWRIDFLSDEIIKSGRWYRCRLTTNSGDYVYTNPVRAILYVNYVEPDPEPDPDPDPQPDPDPDPQPSNPVIVQFPDQMQLGSATVDGLVQKTYDSEMPLLALILGSNAMVFGAILLNHFKFW